MLNWAYLEVPALEYTHFSGANAGFTAFLPPHHVQQL